MVSDVDAAIADAAKTPSRPDRQAGPAPGAPPPTVQSPQPNQQSPIYSPPPSTGDSSAKKWLIGFGAFVVIMLIIRLADDSTTTKAPQTPSPTYSLPSVPTTVEPSPSPRPQVSTRPTEQRPPIGRDNVLAGAQLRYCVAEKIRLDAAELVIDNYNELHVDRFNAGVSDYNSRCGEFRYRQGSLEGAERAMAPYRAELEREGRDRILRSSPTGANRHQGVGLFVPDPQPRKPDLDPTVLAIQRRLNELGYDVGTADGFSGQRTVAAIREFQRDRGFIPDGRATELLLRQLTDPPTPNDSRRVPLATLPSAPVREQVRSSSTDKANFRTCIAGQYPALCKHELLTPDEAVEVAAAEQRANFNTCISGQYPALCKHELLNPAQAAQVIAAEKRVNLETCMSGQYPALCKHSLLTQEEAVSVDAAERRVNFETCRSGQYPALCKYDLLTEDQAAQVHTAERAVNLRTCLSGTYPSLCKHSLLTDAEREQVAAAERRAANR